MVSPGTDNAAISAGTWEAAMKDGQVALTSRDFTAAYRHFGSAHGLGHNQLARHLAAHAGLLATARSQHKAGKIARYLLLLTGAALFDKDHSRTKCPVCHAADSAANRQA
ncbi:MAG TPA: DUF3703 domain-containing protein [Streptosporangiaceae bacterium]|nr:DUF3703 domain-containing protein [Streptosporangiaceae bacterium]